MTCTCVLSAAPRPLLQCNSSGLLTIVDEEGVAQLHIQLRLAQREALAVPAQQHITQRPRLNRLIQNGLHKQPSAPLS